MAVPTVDRLLWLRYRARFWITALKRRRKYLIRRGAPFGPEEADTLRVLLDLERSAKLLLDLPDLADAAGNSRFSII